MAEGRDVFLSFVKPIRRLVSQKGFPSATEPQIKAVPPILRGENVLLVAPTGTGKTEAAFLPILNILYTMVERPQGIKLLYITPLRALNRDLLERLEWWCKQLDIRLAVRHGDTEARERWKQRLMPPDILITTPETLQAILPGRVMRNHLKQVRWVIVDEVHELAGEKRGSQLAVGLQRLLYITGRDFQTIGLSATVGTPDKIASFLVGEGGRCNILKVPMPRSMRIRVVYPKATAEDVELAGKLYTFPQVAARLRAIRRLIEGHRSTLLFTNTRTEAEILASRFRVWDIEFPIAVHHGSLSKPTRLAAEKGLKEGELHGLVCTSSLELGVDIGLLDLVIQYGSPRQVARLLQRVGRSGHKVAGVANGVIVAQDSDDLLEAAAIARRAFAELLEPVEVPEKPFDALAHQLVGLLMQKSRWGLEEAFLLLRRAYPYRDLSREDLEKTLTYMHERYPRFVWFSKEGGFFTKPQDIRATYGYYFENLSMIPEEKHFLVLDEEESPIGVLDEAFVAEHGELGTKFIVAGKPWKITQIYQDKIYVKSEDDPTGAVPSWVGEEIPVPFEIASEVGAIRGFVEAKVKEGVSLQEVAASLVSQYPTDMESTVQALEDIKRQVDEGYPVPTDQRVTIEKWEDYVVMQCCFGHLVNRTLSRILGYLLSQKVGAAVGAHQDPYRIVLRTDLVSPEDVKSTLYDLVCSDLKDLAVQAFIKSGVFKRRFVHVGKKFGALAKDVDLSSANLNNLMEAFKGTVVFEEAVRTALREDADVERTNRLLNRISSSEIDVVTVDNRGQPTPMARMGLEKLKWRSDLMPPDRMRRVIIDSVRARLMSEARTLVCVDCWDHVSNVKVVSLARGWVCPECGSSKFGLSEEAEDRILRLCEKVHLHRGDVPKRFRRLHRKIISSSELIERYGFPAVIVLAAKSIRLSEVADILKNEGNITDRLIELIIEYEKKALKSRYLSA